MVREDITQSKEPPMMSHSSQSVFFIFTTLWRLLTTVKSGLILTPGLHLKMETHIFQMSNPKVTYPVSPRARMKLRIDLNNSTPFS